MTPPTNGWTVSTLKELMDTRFEALKEAVDKSEIALKEYKTTANEFRGTLKDQSAEFIRRTEVEANFERMRELIELNQRAVTALQRSQSWGEGSSTEKASVRTSNQFVLGLVITIIATAASVIVALITKH